MAVKRKRRAGARFVQLHHELLRSHVWHMLTTHERCGQRLEESDNVVLLLIRKAEIAAMRVQILRRLGRSEAVVQARLPDDRRSRPISAAPQELEKFRPLVPWSPQRRRLPRDEPYCL